MDSEASVGNTEQMNISKGQNLNDPSVSSSLKDNPDQELAVTEKGVSVNSPRSVPEKSLPGNRQLRHVYDDSLEMDMRKGPLHHAPAKMITIPESVRLLEKQQKLHKVMNDLGTQGPAHTGCTQTTLQGTTPTMEPTVMKECSHSMQAGKIKGFPSKFISSKFAH